MRRPLLGGLVLVAGALVYVGLRWKTHHADAAAGRALPSRGPVFEVVRVDDDLELQPGSDPLPTGLTTEVETVAGRQHLYFQLQVPQGLTNPEARDQATGWIQAHVQLPPDDAVVWSVASAPGAPLRSYFLRGQPFVSSADLAGAEAVAGDQADDPPRLRLRLTPGATPRFESVRRTWTGKRLALLLEGTVVGAPLADASADLVLTLGRGATLENAQVLAAALAPRR